MASWIFVLCSAGAAKKRFTKFASYSDTCLASDCCIFWPAFGSCNSKCLWTCAFSFFGGKKLKREEKVKNVIKLSEKCLFFKFAIECWLRVFLGIKPLTSIFMQTKFFFAKFCCNLFAFSSFFSFFAQKNNEEVYFNQHSECAAPKHWSNYSTRD